MDPDLSFNLLIAIWCSSINIPLKLSKSWILFQKLFRFLVINVITVCIRIISQTLHWLFIYIIHKILFQREFYFGFFHYFFNRRGRWFGNMFRRTVAFKWWKIISWWCVFTLVMLCTCPIRYLIIVLIHVKFCPLFSKYMYLLRRLLLAFTSSLGLNGNILYLNTTNYFS